MWYFIAFPIWLSDECVTKYGVILKYDFNMPPSLVRQQQAFSATPVECFLEDKLNVNRKNTGLPFFFFLKPNRDAYSQQVKFKALELQSL